jgi:hypothetical protein
LTTSSPISPVFAYDKPGTFINYVEPENIFTASNTIGQSMQVGVRTSSLSTMLYYFKDTTNFDFTDDVGFRCTAYDIDFGKGPMKNNRMDLAIFFAGVCEEGGEVWFRYFVKGAESWSSKGGVSGLSRGNWKVTSRLIGYKSYEGRTQNTADMPVFVATALNEYTNEARVWTFLLDKDENGNYFFLKVTETTQRIQNGKINIFENFDFNPF